MCKIVEGSCNAALVGGVNLMLSPHLFICFSKARMLSPDCRCRTFDHRANGYARGEGAGAVFLKPLNAARKEEGTILAVVRGSAINHDGRSASLTAPNGPAQQAVIRAALQSGGVKPTDITILEAHGTGKKQSEAVSPSYTIAPRKPPLSLTLHSFLPERGRTSPVRLLREADQSAEERLTRVTCRSTRFGRRPVRIALLL